MGKSFKYWILVFALAGFTLGVYSQGPIQGPPEPTAQNQGGGNSNRPCGPPGQGKGNGLGNGQGIPPPVGLCLPINDYLLPLLISGIALGGFMVWRLEGHPKSDHLVD